MTKDELTTLLSGAPAEVVKALSVKPIYEPVKADGKTPLVTADFRKQYEVAGHDVLDNTKRKDKQVKKGTGDQAEARIELVNRIGIPFQEIITERAVSFLFGTPVKITASPDGDNQQAVFDALRRILKDNKIDPFNQTVALDLFRCKEVAEIWYAVQKPEVHNDYGFETKSKLRVLRVSPWDGSELYPLFDETGDMIAFSRSYQMPGLEENKPVSYFETYTDTETIIWKKEESEWGEPSRTANAIGKIPVVYARQEKTEWENVQSLIDRLEKLLSNYADTTDYHASPTIFVSGTILGMPDKGESGKVIQGMDGAKAEYLSWRQAPEMVKLEIETLLTLIYSLSQTPDISFESIKGIGAVSGVALKLMFTDAHLKVKKKQRIFDAYLDRRASVILSFIGVMNTKLTADTKAINVESQVQPFMIGDTDALIQMLTTATGGKAVISQKTAVGQTGLVEDADAEFELIQAEGVASATEPTL
ncbi:MAG: phage portal protein [Spirosoma sp.]|nr:phage portal protein [Spirosoma sp.]